MIEVRDKNNNVRCEVEITDKCVYSKTLMEDEYVLLSFESDTLIGFQKKDFIKTDFGTFRIKDITKPEPQTDGGYLYEQKFVPDWKFWGNRILFYNRQLGFEKSWKMTQRPEYFMDIVVRNIQDAGFGQYSFEIDSSLTEMKLVEFDSTNIIDALTAIAEAWETEWWIADTVIHISKCEFGSPVSLAEGEELGDIERDDGQDTTYITRAYVFGSTRNLPTNYRKNEDEDAVVEGVVETRLKLPANIPYVDAWENMNEEDIVEGVILLDEIYPRNVGTISTVTTKRYTDKIENEDGTTTNEDWNAFRFTDATLPHFSKEYILADQDLHIVFQTGKLAGMDFVVNFNPDGENEKETASQVFEIVRNEDYGVALPTDTFKPEVGDTYILYGYDTTYVYDNLVSKAEQELYEKAVEEVAEAAKDKSVYTCPTNPLRCAGYKPNSIGKMVHTTADEIDLDVGQSVTLISANQFESGSRLSRVRGLEKRLDNKYNCTYTIGESSAYSRNSDLQEQIDELTYQSKQFVNVYGNSVYVVKRYDTTAPSDTNVPSFKRAQYEFLQRNVPNRATKKISFDEGVELGNYTQGEQGGLIDGNGNAELLTMIVRKLISSAHYTSGFNGEGYRLWIDDKGLSNLELDKLTVRQIMTVFELIIDRIRAVGGQIVVSAANGKIKAVEDTGEAYKITFEGDNYFQAHDLMRCQVFTGSDIRSYWVEAAGIGSNYVEVAKSEFAEGVDPKEGDEVVLMGNTENTNRQNLISISATEDGEPRIDVLDGVSEKNFDNALRARLGNLDGITDDWFPLDNQPQGNGLYADNAYLRGTFLLTTGEDIKTKFEVTEGKITSSVEALRQDFMQDKGYLNNPTFGDGLNHWSIENDTKFFILGNKWIWANDNVLSKKGDGVSLATDESRTVVSIKNKYICQKFADLRALPEIKTNKDGKKEPVAVYVSFYYKVVKKGTLKIGFENINNDGFVDYEPFSYSQELDVTTTYQQLTTSGLWNATGDFKLSFTGEIFVYMFVLSTDEIETLTYTYRTFFEQSDRLVKISSAVYDKDESALKETGLLIKPEGAGLYAQDKDGNVALIGVSVEETDPDGKKTSKIKLTADHILLEGAVTANDNFKVLEDGSIEAKNGKFTGEIDATSGTIGGFSISENKISTNSDAALQIGGESFNTCFGISSSTKSVTVQANESYPVLNNYDFAYKENNRFTLRNTTTKKYDWLNIGVANVMDMDFFSSTSSSQQMPNRYGYQYAMLGTGHVAMDGIVDGGCLSIVSDWSADNQVRMLTPPFEANRVAVSSKYSGDIVVLPDLYSVLSVFGYGISHSNKKKFSFRMDIVNMGDNTMYIAGRNTDKVNGKQYYTGEELPRLFSNQSEKTTLKGVAIYAHSMIEVLLVYDGTEYQAYIMKSN